MRRLAVLVVAIVAGNAASVQAGGHSSPAPIGLTFTAFDAPVILQHVTPRTLSPEGNKLRLAGPGGNEGVQWARSGNTLALEVYGANREPTPIRLVDTGRLRVRRSIPAGPGDVCGLTFDGPTLVVLTAVPWCNNGPQVPTAFSVLRIDISSGQVTRLSPVAGLAPFLYPVSLAFGDGHAYVARASGAVESIDLGTGALSVRTPRRALAKGARAVAARWLGTHLLGLGPRIVDVRTWRARLLTADAQRLTAGGSTIVAFGNDGATVGTRSGKPRFRILPGENIRDAHVVGRYLYADVDAGTEVVDLQTRKRISVVPHANSWTLLAR